MDVQTFLTALTSMEQISDLHFYGLLFLLGSFTVASLSDLKRMAAQKEFAEIWILFTMVFFGYDFYRLSGEMPLTLFMVKWTLIMLFALFSWKLFGFILSLSFMDLAAACAVMSLLNPQFILTYYVILLLSNLLLKPFLRKSGDRISIPFMPVILISTIIILVPVRLVDLTGLQAFLS